MSAKTAGIPRCRPFAGPALLRQGFRPFFLGAGTWALLAMVADVYLPLLRASALRWSTAFGLFVVHHGRMLLSR